LALTGQRGFLDLQTACFYKPCIGSNYITGVEFDNVSRYKLICFDNLLDSAPENSGLKAVHFLKSFQCFFCSALLIQPEHYVYNND
jgi:hypothetical protein